jgi:hypothetical protein
MARQSGKDYLSGAETHEVFNVPEPLENYNAYTENVNLQQLVSWCTPWAQLWQNLSLAPGAKKPARRNGSTGDF